MRLFPTAPISGRIVKKAFMTSIGVEVPKGNYFQAEIWVN